MADSKGRVSATYKTIMEEQVIQDPTYRADTFVNVYTRSKEVNYSLANAKYQIDNLKIVDEGGIGHGYYDGKRVYACATTSALTPLDTNSSAEMADISWLYVKHSGLRGIDNSVASCVITSGSAVVTMASTSSVIKDAFVHSDYFAAGTYVVSVDSATQITMSNNGASNQTATIRYIGASPAFTNTADYLAVYNGTTLVSLLPPGGAVATSLYSNSAWSSRINSQQFQIASRSSTDVDNYGVASIAVEYLMFGAY